MRKIMLLVVMAAALCFMTSAFASEKTLEFPGGSEGKVIFDGQAHNAKLPEKCNACHSRAHSFGFPSVSTPEKCKACHTDGIFPRKSPGSAGAAIMTMAAMKEGEYCGACHNGTKAFNANDKANCTKCHKK